MLAPQPRHRRRERLRACRVCAVVSPAHTSKLMAAVKVTIASGASKIRAQGPGATLLLSRNQWQPQAHGAGIFGWTDGKAEASDQI